MLPEYAKRALTPEQIQAIDGHPLAAQICAVNLDVMSGTVRVEFANDTCLKVSPTGRLEIIYEWRTYQELRRMGAAIESCGTAAQGFTASVQEIKAAMAELQETTEQIQTLVATHLLTWAGEGQRPIPRLRHTPRCSLIYNAPGSDGGHSEAGHGEMDRIHVKGETVGQ